MKIFCVLLVFGAFLCACAPSPQDYADASASESRTLSNAAAANQELIQKQAEWQYRQAIWKRSADQVVSATNVLIWVGTVTLGAVLIGWGLGAGIAGTRIGVALGRVAILRASLVPLDAKTGQYPALQYVGKGWVSLTNPNNGEVLMLNTASVADRERIAGVEHVQLAGVLSKNAASHKTQPGAIAALGWPGAVQTALDVYQENDND